MKNCVVNVSTSKFAKGQDRLIQTLAQNGGDLIVKTYQEESQVGSPPHKDCMYGFKPFAFDYLRNHGFSKVLWLDASMYVLKDLTPIFDLIEKQGYYFEYSGWENERFTPPNVAEYMGTNKGQMISAGVLGLDLNNPIAIEFLGNWKQAAVDGMFNGSHDNFRHDQSCASLIIEKMGLQITDNSFYWQYGVPGEQPLHDNILIYAHGIC